MVYATSTQRGPIEPNVNNSANTVKRLTLMHKYK